MEDFIFMAELESDLRDEYMMNLPEDFIALMELKEDENYDFFNSFHEEIQLF